MKRIQALLAVIALATIASVQAATIDITWSAGVFDPAGVDVGTITMTAPAVSTGTDAGRFKGTGSNPVGVSTALFPNYPTIYAYCYDLVQTISGGQTVTYTIQAGATADVLDFLGAANAYLAGGDLAWLSPGSSNVAAAIQLGIWEGLYDTGFLLGAGNLKFAAVNATVQGIYDSIVGLMAANGSLVGSRVMVLHSETRQDVITGTSEEFDVPEPATLVLLGFAALAAGVARRRAH